MEMAPAPMMDQVEASGAASVDRSEIITGDIYLTVDDTASTADQVTALVEEAGGRVDSRSDYLDYATGLPSSYLWVRIPVDALEATMDSIEALGAVERSSINRSDVTLQVIDLEARIAVLDDSLARLQALLDQAETVADLIELESAIAQRQAERDSLGSQQTYLRDQIQFASIGVELRTSEEAPDRTPGGFIDGIISGWNSLVAFAQGALIFLGVLVPWVGVAALIAAPIIVWLVWRRKKSV